MGLRSSSFGLEATSGLSANPSAMKAARARGLDLSLHMTKTPDLVPLASGDLLAVMESWQARAFQSRELPLGVQVTLLGLWCDPPRPHIEDPFGLSDHYFETCFTLIDNALACISALVQKRDTASQPL
jgi:protein-tyrosine phosphatase